MKRILTYPVPTAGLTVKEFLLSKGYSSRSLITFKKDPETILLNHAPVYLNRILAEGDILSIHLTENTSSEKILPVPLDFSIVYEDEDLLVVNKPANMPIHPSMKNYDNSLANALAWYYKEQECPFVFRCINRLDRDTSGLTLIAKHSVCAGILSDMISHKADAFHQASGSCPETIHREYLAIVRGKPSPSSGVICAPIARKADSIIEREVNEKTGETAITHYQLLEEHNGHSLLKLRLETGRTHQIRVHMKHIGYPLIGDYLYNPDFEWINRQALHSYRLILRHPIKGFPMEFTAPMPYDMRRVLQADNSAV